MLKSFYQNYILVGCVSLQDRESGVEMFASDCHVLPISVCAISVSLTPRLNLLVGSRSVSKAQHYVVCFKCLQVNTVTQVNPHNKYIWPSWCDTSLSIVSYCLSCDPPARDVRSVSINTMKHTQGGDPDKRGGTRTTESWRDNTLTKWS